MIVPFDRRAYAEDSFDAMPPHDPAMRESRAARRRSARIHTLAGAASERWLQRYGDPDPDKPVLQPLPRPRGLGVPKGPTAALPPRRQEEVFRARWTFALSRVFIWMWGAFLFLTGVLWDKLRGRDDVYSRARRLRRTFESLGTTFIKLGQQLSMRLDLLPYAYTRELESMLDHVPPMRSKAAVAAIERTTGKKLDEIFSAFDLEPIGSASVACVYQAILRTGEAVAVKVRRPGIGQALAADMRALGWILTIAELIALPANFTSNFLFELRTMLLEELDFVREARFTDLYRRETRKRKQFHFVTAPRVYFDFSSSEVLVTEFVTGVWMHEVITAFETSNEAAVAKLEEMNIDRVVLARRIQLVARFNNFEHIFFHADIHPANILVQPGNKLVLIDFGSCGSFSRKELNSWRRWFDAQSIDDVGGMAQAAMAIIEPIPPIDKDEFAMRLETMFWDDLYAIKSKHSDWSERISARLWLGFLKLLREYRIPMRLNTLRMIRASMLADTIAARLDNDQDPYAEFRHYEKGAGRRARRRIFKRLRRLKGPQFFIRLENGIEGGLKFVYQAQRALDSLGSIGVIPLIGKAAHSVLMMLRATAFIAGLWLVWTFIPFVRDVFVNDPDASFVRQARVTLDNDVFQLIAVLIVIIAALKIHARMHYRDSN